MKGFVGQDDSVFYATVVCGYDSARGQLVGFATFAVTDQRVGHRLAWCRCWFWMIHCWIVFCPWGHLFFCVFVYAHGFSLQIAAVSGRVFGLRFSHSASAAWFFLGAIMSFWIMIRGPSIGYFFGCFFIGLVCF